MSKTLLIALLIFIVSIAGDLTSVAASPHEHHSAHQKLSPFEKQSDLPNHCILHGHSLNKPCPHLLKEVRDRESFFISSDCGGSPTKKLPASTNVKKQEIFSGIIDFPDPACSSTLHVTYSNSSNLFPFSLYHPPRFI